LGSRGRKHKDGGTRTEEENERLIAEWRDLDDRYDQLTPEEREYAELLGMLIEAFEEANYTLEGSRGIAAEVVSRKRAISKAQAKKLAELFHFYVAYPLRALFDLANRRAARTSS
jgi:hypothetical protein